MLNSIFNVSTLHLMSRNLDFVSMVYKTWKTNHSWCFQDQLSYYKTNFLEITLPHRCSPVKKWLHISGHHFIRTPLKDCFFMFKLWFLCFCITSTILRIMLAFIFFYYLIRRSCHWKIFYKEGVLHLYSKITRRSLSFSSVAVSKLINPLNWASSHVFFNNFIRAIS